TQGGFLPVPYTSSSRRSAHVALLQSTTAQQLHSPRRARRQSPSTSEIRIQKTRRLRDGSTVVSPGLDFPEYRSLPTWSIEFVPTGRRKLANSRRSGCGPDWF